MNNQLGQIVQTESINKSVDMKSLREAISEMEKMPIAQKGIVELSALSILFNGIKLVKNDLIPDDEVMVFCGKKAFERIKMEFKK